MLQDQDPPCVVVLSDKRVKARKEHKCDCSFCKRPIAKGTTYNRVAYIDDDGKFRFERYHLSHVDQMEPAY